MINPGDRVQWIYAADNKEELQARYDQWAAEYDRDLDDEFGYVAPARAADAFARFLSTDAIVLDAGAGTGLAGVELAKRGFAVIDAIDLSQGMLDEAAAKGVYRTLRQVDLTERAPIDDDTYDGCLCVGTLTHGHVPASAIDELVRVVKPGGLFVYTLRRDIIESHGFGAKHAELEAAGKVRLLERGDPFQGLPKGEPDLVYNIWAFRVL
ncbi:MAG: class I SAM-dependent methyltransferase [Chloroflexota bacterium]|nr:class I SAM-dependent methyltransferase [Chloroflexota bacterium]